MITKIYSNGSTAAGPTRAYSRTSDIPLPRALNRIFLVVWAITCLIGAAIAIGARQPLLGVIVIAVPTFVGMVLKPTFALCIMMLVLPFGAGVAIPGTFTLNKGVGIVLAISFALNYVFRRPQLYFKNIALWFAILYTLWAILSCITKPHLQLEAMRALTQVQLLALFLFVYFIIRTNTEQAVVITLRSYVVGTVGSIAVALIWGTQIVSPEQAGEGRYVATLGAGQIDANHFGALVGIAFLAAIYLTYRDRQFIWRLLYIAVIPFLGIMLIRIGSRGVLIAVSLSVMMSGISEIRRNPKIVYWRSYSLRHHRGHGFLLFAQCKFGPKIAVSPDGYKLC